MQNQYICKKINCMKDNSSMPQSPKQPVSKKSVMFGVLVILFGIALLLRNIGLLSDVQKEFIFSWKTILIAIGIMNLIGKEFFTGIILISIGVFFHLSHYYIFPINIRNLLWPGIIIAIGIAILFKHFRVSNKFCFNKANNEVNDYFEEVSIFGGSHKYIKNDHFRGAKITAIFGGSKINLQQVNLSPDGAVIDLNLVFGGCEIIVPPDWNVHLGVNNIFGGINDKRLPASIDSSKNIYFKGNCVFGGCEIKSY